MHRYEPRLQAIAFCYAALAGFVDAVGFLKSGGLFVSFMTGNSTRLSVSIGGAGPAAAAALGLIACFVAGVVLGRLASEAAGRRRKIVAACNVVLLLTLAALLEEWGATSALIAVLCLAMGAANTIFVRADDVGIGVTYMTGTLVRFGHRLAHSLRGGARFGWAPYLGLWMALVVGGVAGAASVMHFPGTSLWLAVAVAAALAVAVQRAGQGER